MARPRLALLLGLSVLLAGCGALRSGPRTAAPRADSLARAADSLQRAVATWKERARLRHPTLDATLWAQTAAEYDGVARGAYRLAGAMMERALADSIDWSAVEIPPGSPRVDYFEDGEQWVPRGGVLRCLLPPTRTGRRSWRSTGGRSIGRRSTDC